MCINYCRKKGNRSTKRCVKFALNIPLFLHLKICNIHQSHRYVPSHIFGRVGTYNLYRGYYTVARRYEFYFLVAKQYFANERGEWVKYCFCHEKIKVISPSRRVKLFLLYRQKDIDKIIEGNYRNYVIDKLTCEIMENKPLGSRI